MKKKIKAPNRKGEYVDRYIQYIPARYIFAILITILEIIMVIGIVFLCAIYIPYFYIALYVTVIGIVISIIVSNDNPDYKIPWLLCVICIPIIGFMLYFLFYKRKLTKKLIKKLNAVNESLEKDNEKELNNINDKLIKSQAKELINIANTHIYQNTKLEYYKIGEEMHTSILNELKKAKKFILLEYFIIEEGIFWNSILDILVEKVKSGVEVRVIYDDIGCIATLPGNYCKTLINKGIKAVSFAKLKGQADSEFNNRNHRKILVIDGKVGFSGGVNIADEYINEKEVYGHWKDTGIKLEGRAVNELTKLFLIDYSINSKEEINFNNYYIDYSVESNSFIIPFGDGPRPIFEKNVGKIVIMNLLNQAKDYVYITTPYLIIDNELMRTIENTSLRGVDVRIIVPHIPDKKIVFEMTKSNYQTLIKSGVKIYEYEPGFIHSKLYLSDDTVGMIGTINLDYRSLTHHFENGVWIYNDRAILDMKEDFINTMNSSIYMNDEKIKNNIFSKLIRIIVRVFSPLL